MTQGRRVLSFFLAVVFLFQSSMSWGRGNLPERLDIYDDQAPIQIQSGSFSAAAGVYYDHLRPNIDYDPRSDIGRSIYYIQDPARMINEVYSVHNELIEKIQELHKDPKLAEFAFEDTEAALAHLLKERQPPRARKRGVGEAEVITIDGKFLVRVTHAITNTSFVILDEDIIDPNSEHLRQYQARQHLDSGKGRPDGKIGRDVVYIWRKGVQHTKTEVAPRIESKPSADRPIFLPSQSLPESQVNGGLALENLSPSQKVELKAEIKKNKKSKKSDYWRAIKAPLEWRSVTFGAQCALLQVGVTLGISALKGWMDSALGYPTQDVTTVAVTLSAIFGGVLGTFSSPYYNFVNMGRPGFFQSEKYLVPSDSGDHFVFSTQPKERGDGIRVSDLTEGENSYIWVDDNDRPDWGMFVDSQDYLEQPDVSQYKRPVYKVNKKEVATSKLSKMQKYYQSLKAIDWKDTLKSKAARSGAVSLAFSYIYLFMTNRELEQVSLLDPSGLLVAFNLFIVAQMIAIPNLILNNTNKVWASESAALREMAGLTTKPVEIRLPFSMNRSKIDELLNQATSKAHFAQLLREAIEKQPSVKLPWKIKEYDYQMFTYMMAYIPKMAHLVNVPLPGVSESTGSILSKLGMNLGTFAFATSIMVTRFLAVKTALKLEAEGLIDKGKSDQYLNSFVKTKYGRAMIRFYLTYRKVALLMRYKALSEEELEELSKNAEDLDKFDEALKIDQRISKLKRDARVEAEMKNALMLEEEVMKIAHKSSEAKETIFGYMARKFNDLKSKFRPAAEDPEVAYLRNILNGLDEAMEAEPRKVSGESDFSSSGTRKLTVIKGKSGCASHLKSKT